MTSSGNFRHMMSNYMADAGMSGYAGVMFLYHRISKHLIVEWTGLNVDQNVRSATETILLTIFKVDETRDADRSSDASANNSVQDVNRSNANSLGSKYNPMVGENFLMRHCFIAHSMDEDAQVGAEIQAGTGLLPNSAEEVKANQLLKNSHQCAICGNKFAQADLLSNHMELHSEEALGSAPKCKDSQLQKQPGSKDNSIAPARKTWYKCRHCRKKFGRKLNLHKHILFSHKRVKPQTQWMPPHEVKVESNRKLVVELLDDSDEDVATMPVVCIDEQGHECVEDSHSKVMDESSDSTSTRNSTDQGELQFNGSQDTSSTKDFPNKEPVVSDAVVKNVFNDSGNSASTVVNKVEASTKTKLDATEAVKNTIPGEPLQSTQKIVVKPPACTELVTVEGISANESVKPCKVVDCESEPSIGMPSGHGSPSGDSSMIRMESTLTERENTEPSAEPCAESRELRTEPEPRAESCAEPRTDPKRRTRRATRAIDGGTGTIFKNTVNSRSVSKDLTPTTVKYLSQSPTTAKESSAHSISPEDTVSQTKERQNPGGALEQVGVWLPGMSVQVLNEVGDDAVSNNVVGDNGRKQDTDLIPVSVSRMDDQPEEISAIFVNTNNKHFYPEGESRQAQHITKAKSSSSPRSLRNEKSDRKRSYRCTHCKRCFANLHTLTKHSATHKSAAKRRQKFTTTRRVSSRLVHSTNNATESHSVMDKMAAKRGRLDPKTATQSAFMKEPSNCLCHNSNKAKETDSVTHKMTAKSGGVITAEGNRRLSGRCSANKTTKEHFATDKVSAKQGRHVSEKINSSDTRKRISDRLRRSNNGITGKRSTTYKTAAKQSGDIPVETNSSDTSRRISERLRCSTKKTTEERSTTDKLTDKEDVLVHTKHGDTSGRLTGRLCLSSNELTGKHSTTDKIAAKRDGHTSPDINPNDTSKRLPGHLGRCNNDINKEPSTTDEMAAKQDGHISGETNASYIIRRLTNHLRCSTNETTEEHSMIDNLTAKQVEVVPAETSQSSTTRRVSTRLCQSNKSTKSHTVDQCSLAAKHSDQVSASTKDLEPDFSVKVKKRPHQSKERKSERLRMYQCSVCEMDFHRISLLKKHEQTHQHFCNESSRATTNLLHSVDKIADTAVLTKRVSSPSIHEGEFTKQAFVKLCRSIEGIVDQTVSTNSAVLDKEVDLYRVGNKSEMAQGIDNDVSRPKLGSEIAISVVPIKAVIHQRQISTAEASVFAPQTNGVENVSLSPLETTHQTRTSDAEVAACQPASRDDVKNSFETAKDVKQFSLKKGDVSRVCSVDEEHVNQEEPNRRAATQSAPDIEDTTPVNESISQVSTKEAGYIASADGVVDSSTMVKDVDQSCSSQGDTNQDFSTDNQQQALQESNQQADSVPVPDVEKATHIVDAEKFVDEPDGLLHRSKGDTPARQTNKVEDVSQSTEVISDQTSAYGSDVIASQSTPDDSIVSSPATGCSYQEEDVDWGFSMDEELKEYEMALEESNRQASTQPTPDEAPEIDGASKLVSKPVRLLHQGEAGILATQTGEVADASQSTEEISDQTSASVSDVATGLSAPNSAVVDSAALREKGERNQIFSLDEKQKEYIMEEKGYDQQAASQPAPVEKEATQSDGAGALVKEPVALLCRVKRKALQVQSHSSHHSLRSRKHVTRGFYQCHLCPLSFGYMAVLRKHTLMHAHTTGQSNSQVVVSSHANYTSKRADDAQHPEVKDQPCVLSKGMSTPHDEASKQALKPKEEEMTKVEAKKRSSEQMLKPEPVSNSQHDSKRERQDGYQCHICGKTFDRLWLLNDHSGAEHIEKEVHRKRTKSKISISEDETQSYLCKICETVYVSKYTLKRHMLRKHGDYGRIFTHRHHMQKRVMTCKLDLDDNDKTSPVLKKHTALKIAYGRSLQPKQCCPDDSVKDSDIKDPKELAEKNSVPIPIMKDSYPNEKSKKLASEKDCLPKASNQESLPDSKEHPNVETKMNSAPIHKERGQKKAKKAVPKPTKCLPNEPTTKKVVQLCSPSDTILPDPQLGEASESILNKLSHPLVVDGRKPYYSAELVAGTKDVFKCAFCDLSFHGTSRLASHMKRTHQCDKCGKWFTKTVSLNMHYLCHDQLHQCDFCSMCFGTQQHLDAHKLSHTQ